ncbi:hypothetical protein IQ07DRAFT_674983 [Pyrenochaeta sp. DS3sAY3a]|nr:hypothetical protein IQ07DRAFT_674983 [Pyrenochaeta sp. DS3sAY3a]
MLLPPEILTLLFLATATKASPQFDPVANASSTTTGPALDFTNSAAFNDPTPTESEPPWWEDICATSSCEPARLIPELPTAPGFEVESKALTPTHLGPQRQPDRVVTTRRPTIVNVRTSTAQTLAPRPPTNNRPGANGDDVQSVGVQGQQTGTGAGDDAPGEPAQSPQQQTAPNTLLNDIVSGLGDTTPLPQPTAQAPITPAPTPAPTTIPGTLTLGSATLTLTHGLSTTLGTEPDATFVSLSTDAAGQTIVVISSSGTAITATVSDAPATVTLPKTGFEASITDAARPGVWSTGDGRAAAPTSSRGVAGALRGEVRWWCGVVVGGVVRFFV